MNNLITIVVEIEDSKDLQSEMHTIRERIKYGFPGNEVLASVKAMTVSGTTERRSSAMAKFMPSKHSTMPRSVHACLDGIEAAVVGTPEYNTVHAYAEVARQLLSEQSWKNNPDTASGAFRQDEIEDALRLKNGEY